MSRRSKAELEECGYYKWLEVCDALRKKKKDGGKLSSAEKEILRTVPTPESPYLTEAKQPTLKISSKNRSSTKRLIDPGTIKKDVVWKTAGGHFLCAVFNAPYTDEQCMLFCKVEECPFYQAGYFREHGMKF
jgi:hypothetical protein